MFCTMHTHMQVSRAYVLVHDNGRGLVSHGERKMELSKAPRSCGMKPQSKEKKEKERRGRWLSVEGVSWPQGSEV